MPTLSQINVDMHRHQLQILAPMQHAVILIALLQIYQLVRIIYLLVLTMVLTA